MRLRALAWLACLLGASAGLRKPSPRTAKQDAVDAARDVSSGKVAELDSHKGGESAGGNAIDALGHDDPAASIKDTLSHIEDAPKDTKSKAETGGGAQPVLETEVSQHKTQGADVGHAELSKAAAFDDKGLSGSTARKAAAEMVKSRLATQTTRPVFEQGRRRLECVDEDLGATDSFGDDCSYYDSNPGDCGTGDDDDFTASEQCCACGGGTGDQAIGVGKCRYNEAVDSDQCPPEEELEVMVNCEEAACGTLCEGDGECGTTDIDNCGTHDLYIKYCTSPTPAPTKKVETPTLKPTYKPTFGRCEGVASTSSGTSINLFESEPGIQIVADKITVDGEDSGGVAQALLKFDLAEHAGCNITKAMLRLHTLDKSKDTIKAYRMKSSWDDKSTWSSFGGGVQDTDHEAAKSFKIVAPRGGGLYLDVTKDVEFWLQNTDLNEGWFFRSSGEDGWDFASSTYIDPVANSGSYSYSYSYLGSGLNGYEDDMIYDEDGPTSQNRPTLRLFFDEPKITTWDTKQTDALFAPPTAGYYCALQDPTGCWGRSRTFVEVEDVRTCTPICPDALELTCCDKEREYLSGKGVCDTNDVPAYCCGGDYVCTNVSPEWAEWQGGKLCCEPKTANSGHFATFAYDIVADFVVPALVDLNGDGQVDLVLGLNEELAFYENKGDGKFVRSSKNPFADIKTAGESSPAFAKLYGDKFDLVLGSEEGSLVLYRNVGSDSEPEFKLVVGGVSTTIISQIGDGIGECGVLTPVTEQECPSDTDLDDCTAVRCGELCEGDGECGTSDDFDNCGPQEIYRKSCETADTPLTDGIGLCGVLTPVTEQECPSDTDLDPCDKVACGELCEGDGECGTDDDLNNCLHEDGERTREIYKKTCEPSVDGIGECGYLTPVTDLGEDCPTDTDLDDCTAVRCGELCEGDGECGTDGDLNNCLDVDGDRTIEIYRKTCTEPNPFAGINVGRYSSPSLADMDGDGDDDLVVGRENGALTYYKNIGNRTVPRFQLVIDSPFATIYVASESIPSLGDIDGDGRPDLAVGNKRGDILLYRNIGSRTQPEFAQAANSVLNHFRRPRHYQVDKAENPFGEVSEFRECAPAFGDVDGDGWPDFVLGTSGDGIRFYHNVRALVLDRVVGKANPFGGIELGRLSRPAFADLDGDGLPDLLIGNADSKKALTYYRNVGNVKQPKFREAEVSPFATINDMIDRRDEFFTPVLGDVDGDGDQDLLVGSYQRLVLYLNDGDASAPDFGEPLSGAFGGTEGSSLDIYTESRPYLGDLNGDGQLDLLIGDDDGKLWFYRNTGSLDPIFEQVGRIIVDQDVGSYVRPALGDIDGDGLLDLVLGDADRVTIYRNVGNAKTPVFENYGATILGGNMLGTESAPAFVDLDNDGELELVIADRSGILSMFANRICVATEPPCSGSGTCIDGTCECSSAFTGDQCESCREGHIGLTCEPCKKQTFSIGGPPLADDECLPCPAGEFSVAGAGTCELCPGGQYRSAADVEVTGCIPCVDDTWSNPGQACDLCAIGSYRDESNKCRSCTPDMVCTTNDVTLANFGCRTKTYRDGDTCEFCNDNMICETTDVTLDNFKCIAGTYRVGDECENCKSGMVCDEPGVTIENVRLEKNRWRTSAESAKIEECPLKKSCRSTKPSPDANVSAVDKFGVARRLEAVAAPANTTDAGEALCTKGHEGPLCAVCKRHYYRLGQECIKCRPSTIAFTVIGVLVGIVVFLAFFLMAMTYSNLAAKGVGKSFEKSQESEVSPTRLSRQGSTYFARADTAAEKSNRPDPKDVGSGLWQGLKRWLSEGNAADALRRNVTTFVKQLSGTYSIFVNLPWVFDIKFPNLYEKVLERLAIVNVNMSFSLECVMSRKVTFQDQLLAATIGPIVAILIVVVIGLGVLWLGFKRNEHKHRADRKRTTIMVIAQLVLLILFLSYTSTSTIIFRAFRPCDRLDEKYHGSNLYMHDDYSVSCKSSRYVFIVTWAALMLLVYPIGIPLVSFCLMWRHQEKLNPKVDSKFFHKDLKFETVGESESAFRQACVEKKTELRNKAVKAQDRELVSFAQLFHFMYDNYEPRYWWFECFDYLRRLALTGLMVIILPGSALQGFIGVLIALCGLLAYVQWKPFKEDASDWLGVSTQLSTFFLFLSALMVQVNAVYHRKGFGVLLTVVTFMPPFVSLCAALREFNFLSPKEVVPGSNEDSSSNQAKDDVADPESSPTSPLARGAPPQEDEEAPAAPAQN